MLNTVMPMMRPTDRLRGGSASAIDVGAVAGFDIEGLSSGCVGNAVPGTVILGPTRSGRAGTVRHRNPHGPANPNPCARTRVLSRSDRAPHEYCESSCQSAPKSNDADSDASSTASASCSRSAE